MTNTNEDGDGLMWPPNVLKAMQETMQETSEQATKKQQEALQSLFMGAGAASPDLKGITEELGAMSQMATFKTRIQSGGRISIPDAEREALDIGEGDIVQTVVVPVKRTGEDDE